jgi:putative transcriptional regulator
MVHVSRQTIIAIEKGNYSPTVTLALKIARVLGARVEDLFFYE